MADKEKTWFVTVMDSGNRVFSWMGCTNVAIQDNYIRFNKSNGKLVEIVNAGVMIEEE
jgi:hypothetical protein